MSGPSEDEWSYLCDLDTVHAAVDFWKMVDLVLGSFFLVTTIIMIFLFPFVPSWWRRIGDIAFVLLGCASAQTAVVLDGFTVNGQDDAGSACRLRLVALQLGVTWTLAPLVGKVGTIFALRRQHVLPSLSAAWDKRARRISVAIVGAQVLMETVFLLLFLDEPFGAEHVLTVCTADWAEFAFHICQAVYVSALVLVSLCMLLAARRHAGPTTEVSTLAMSTVITGSLQFALSIACTAHASPAVLPFRFIVCELMALHQMIVHVVPPVVQHALPRLRKLMAWRRARRRLSERRVARKREALEQQMRRQHVLVSALEAQLEEARAGASPRPPQPQPRLKLQQTRLRLMTSPLLQDWCEYRVTRLDPQTMMPRDQLDVNGAAVRPRWRLGFVRLFQNRTLVAWASRAEALAGRAPLKTLDLLQLHELSEAKELPAAQLALLGALPDKVLRSQLGAQRPLSLELLFRLEAFELRLVAPPAEAARGGGAPGAQAASEDERAPPPGAAPPPPGAAPPGDDAEAGRPGGGAAAPSPRGGKAAAWADPLEQLQQLTHRGHRWLRELREMARGGGDEDDTPSFREVRLWVGTWNMGNTAPDRAQLRAWLGLERGERHDVYVFGLQESAFPMPKEDGAAGPGAQSALAKTQMLSCAARTPRIHAPAPRVQRAASAPALRPRRAPPCHRPRADSRPLHAPPVTTSTLTQQLASLLLGVLGAEYRLLERRCMWELRLLVFAHADLGDDAELLDAASEPTGLGGVGGNKGGVAAALSVHGTTFCFVTAHLAAHQPKTAQRNEMAAHIFRGLRELAGAELQGTRHLEPAATFHHTFFFGDLNYRIDLPLERVVGLLEELGADDAGKAAEALAALHAHDQLRAEQRAGRTLAGFDEPAPPFPPTFKRARARGNEREADDDEDDCLDSALRPSSVALSSGTVAALSTTLSRPEKKKSATHRLLRRSVSSERTRPDATPAPSPPPSPPPPPPSDGEPSVSGGGADGGAAASDSVQLELSVIRTPPEGRCPVPPPPPSSEAASAKRHRADDGDEARLSQRCVKAGYNPSRIPSWCDRILVRSWDEHSCSRTSYRHEPTVDTSDHTPVSATFCVRVVLPPPVDAQRHTNQWELQVRGVRLTLPRSALDEDASRGGATHRAGEGRPVLAVEFGGSLIRAGYATSRAKLTEKAVPSSPDDAAGGEPLCVGSWPGAMELPLTEFAHAFGDERMRMGHLVLQVVAYHGTRRAVLGVALLPMRAAVGEEHVRLEAQLIDCGVRSQACVALDVRLSNVSAMRNRRPLPHRSPDTRGSTAKRLAATTAHGGDGGDGNGGGGGGSQPSRRASLAGSRRSYRRRISCAASAEPSSPRLVNLRSLKSRSQNQSSESWRKLFRLHTRTSVYRREACFQHGRHAPRDANSLLSMKDASITPDDDGSSRLPREIESLSDRPEPLPPSPAESDDGGALTSPTYGRLDRFSAAPVGGRGVAGASI